MQNKLDKVLLVMVVVMLILIMESNSTESSKLGISYDRLITDDTQRFSFNFEYFPITNFTTLDIIAVVCLIYKFATIVIKLSSANKQQNKLG